LESTPAIVVDHESAAVRNMMKYVEQSGDKQALPKQKLEINPNHPVMKKILTQIASKPELAAMVAEQVMPLAPSPPQKHRRCLTTR
jgi:HSP90 family molecular chaperone